MYLTFISLILKCMTHTLSREKGPYFLSPSPVVGCSGCFRLSLFNAVLARKMFLTVP